ncbi:hypothetical protein L198_03517 [Cryptococcus wingfieldii CBS 7118]|uniref:Chromatin modification-related protein n=1 Tax=Cryptococcus wingfieldii CBS 7118 TaxID=1295528 RepID=A0A1E3JBP9_9TREE|nr:hypothetical protein L198_03517 [Cryptococcus wingfieldii CBS 7118]ODN98274.1 hypothetical protein L198_03517 [Cryptococcus wingfieldii CBS 7118]
MGTNKRPRRSNNPPQSPPSALLGEEDGSAPSAPDKPIDTQQELEAWQEFAADHYETVEQLPLELHRNFRLLRELDDGALAQLGMLQDSMRQYIQERVALEQSEAPKEVPQDVHEEDPSRGSPIPGPSPAETPLENTPSLAAHGEESASQLEKQEHDEGKGDLDVEMTELPPHKHHSPPDPASQTIDTLEDDNAPEAEGPGDTTPARDSSTLADPLEGQIGPAVEAESGTISSPGQSQRRETNDTASQQPSFLRPPGPHSLLPEIARLSRELVRTNDEKVAVAIGAYNAIDRHIRALDSALTAQEAAILLGLRPSTLPSNAIDHTLAHDGGSAKTGLPGDSGPGVGSGTFAGASGLAEGDEGEISLGLGGGGTRKKGKKRRNRKGRQEEAGGVGALGNEQEDWSIPVDPQMFRNEPRYCYCHRVSFGEMIGCDNDDCPLEWFHLQCTNLTHPPTGKWLCNMCRPPAAGEEGGEPKRSHKAGAGRSHKAGAGTSHKAGAGRSHKAGAGASHRAGLEEGLRAGGADEPPKKKARTR